MIPAFLSRIKNILFIQLFRTGKVSVILLSGILITGLVSCDSFKQSPPQSTSSAPSIVVPEFHADSAYEFVKKQCDFGPRVPNTKAHAACADFLVEKFKTYTPDVIVQSAQVKTWDGVVLNMKNIIAVFNPELKQRILLFAHWDTRPWADQDTVNPDKPNLGADDGASGVGVLLEVARHLAAHSAPVGIDIVLFDAEDWGQKGGGPGSEDTYALGAQYWVKNPHQPAYQANYGILLDMVGSKGAQFRREGFSQQYAPYVLDKVWKAGHRLGYSEYFLFQEGGYVTDDHVYVNRMGIPSIDIINGSTATRHGFGAHWHTHADNMEVIDRNTLKAVGQTLLEVIYKEASL